jgi:uncharacterized membrane protein HdeD (DUF308 family)
MSFERGGSMVWERLERKEAFMFIMLGLTVLSVVVTFVLLMQKNMAVFLTPWTLLAFVFCSTRTAQYRAEVEKLRAEATRPEM